MRDPKRIPIVLEAIRAAWELDPDWRLTQLLYNLLDLPTTDDLFYVEDSRLLEEARAALKVHYGRF